MSWVFKTGTIKSFSKTAIEDSFVSKPVATIFFEDGSNVEYIVGTSFKYTGEMSNWGDFQLYKPAISDKVKVGWDYGNMSGEILVMGSNREAPEDFKIEGSRLNNLHTILDSLYPPGVES